MGAVAIAILGGLAAGCGVQGTPDGTLMLAGAPAYD